MGEKIVIVPLSNFSSSGSDEIHPKTKKVLAYETGCYSRYFRLLKGTTGAKILESVLKLLMAINITHKIRQGEEKYSSLLGVSMLIDW